MRKQEQMLITSHNQIAKDIFELVLTGELVQTMFEAGQFVNVKTGDSGLLLRRPISICQINHEKSEMTLIYRAGDSTTGTRVLANKVVGETVDILGPLGTGFNLEGIGKNETVLLVGGGIGVPPMYETAKRLHAKGIAVVAVLGFASIDDVFYEEKFAEVATVHIATMDGSHGFKGHVVQLIEEKNINFDWVFGCGPHVMLTALAKNYGDKKGYLSFEERMACGIGACYACICEAKDGTRSRVCKEGPVYPIGEVKI